MLIRRYIEDYGPLIWTKATWESYPPELNKQAQTLYEVEKKGLIGRYVNTQSLNRRILTSSIGNLPAQLAG